MPGMQQSLAVIGAGNMGRAIIDGAIAQGILPPDEILVVDINDDRRRDCAALGCVVSDRPVDALTRDQVLLAIKPQDFANLAAQVGRPTSPTVFISIMAGLASDAIRAPFGAHARVVRVMPNTPAQVGAGMAGIALGAGAQPGDEGLAVRMFNAIGRTIVVDEGQMHAVTAVSGSGPAYVFLLAESMEQAAMQVGLSRHDARVLVAQTILGAGRLLSESDKSADALRQQVTSPGGTTAAAVEVMFERELPQIIAEAVIAARDRGQELGEAAVSQRR